MTVFEDGAINLEKFGIHVGFTIRYYINGKPKKNTIYKTYDKISEVESKAVIYEYLKDQISLMENKYRPKDEMYSISFIPPENELMYIMVNCSEFNPKDYTLEDREVKHYYGCA